MQVTRIIKSVWVPSLVIIGTILNLLTIMVFCRRRMRKYCLSISMICLAIADTAVLLVPVLLTWIDETFFTYHFVNKTVWCNLHGYVDLVSCANSSWIIILISSERWFAVCKPWQKNKIFTSCMVKKTLVAIFIASILLFVYFPICVRLNDVECEIEHKEIYSIFGTLSVILVYVLPFFILAFLNIMIIVRLRQRPFQKKTTNLRRKLSAAVPKNSKGHQANEVQGSEETQNNNNQQLLASIVTNNSKNDQNLSITLVTLAITFMILTFPFQAHWFYENIYSSIWSISVDAQDTKKNSTQERISATESFSTNVLLQSLGNGTLIYDKNEDSQITLGDVTFMIKNMNYLINFFLYSALSKLFRQEFLAMISTGEYWNRCLKWPCPSQNQHSSLAELSFSSEAFKSFKNGDYRNAKKKMFLVKLEPANFFEYFRSRNRPVRLDKLQTKTKTTLLNAESDGVQTNKELDLVVDNVTASPNENLEMTKILEERDEWKSNRTSFVMEKTHSLSGSDSLQHNRNFYQYKEKPKPKRNRTLPKSKYRENGNSIKFPIASKFSTEEDISGKFNSRSSNSGCSTVVATIVDA